jgi:hypothetical protein
LTGVVVEAQVYVRVRIRAPIVNEKMSQTYQGCIARLLKYMEVQGRGTVGLRALETRERDEIRSQAEHEAVILLAQLHQRANGWCAG